LLLGDFGATKDEASLQGNSEQTGLYSKFFADADARAGNFGPKSDVYAFALCAYFILHGEPLFNEQNENAYDNNSAKNEKGRLTWNMLKTTINNCLKDDPNERPDFKEIEGEVLNLTIWELCRKRTE
jgi:serine/threonine protein kinase